MKLLSTKRLNLRLLSENDYSFFSEVMNLREVIMNMHWKKVNKEFIDSEFKAFLNDAISQDPIKKFNVFKVSLKNDETPIGFINLTVCGIENNRYFHEIGYMLHTKHWNNGYAFEAGKGIIQYGFEELKSHRILAFPKKYNEKSIRLLEKLKFIKEGHFREECFENGKWIDITRYCLLDNDYFNYQTTT